MRATIACMQNARRNWARAQRLREFQTRVEFLTSRAHADKLSGTPSTPYCKERSTGRTQSRSSSTATERCRRLIVATSRYSPLMQLRIPSAPARGPRSTTIRSPVCKKGQGTDSTHSTYARARVIAEFAASRPASISPSTASLPAFPLTSYRLSLPAFPLKPIPVQEVADPP